MKKKPKQLPLIANDPWLEPFSEAIEGRHARVTDKIKELTAMVGHFQISLQVICILDCTELQKDGYFANGLQMLRIYI